jgi:hypothetical protein
MSTNKPVLGTISVITERDVTNAQMYRDNQSKRSYYFGDGQSVNIFYWVELVVKSLSSLHLMREKKSISKRRVYKTLMT